MRISGKQILNPQDEIQYLLELLEYAILQRFPKLKEVQKMIQLTPLEETVAVQELIQMGVAMQT